MNKYVVARLSLALLATLLSPALARPNEAPLGGADVERALRAAEAAPGDESYQRVYEAFTKLVDKVSSNSLGNVRRLVSRLNNLVGGQAEEKKQTGSSSAEKPQLPTRAEQQQQQNELQSVDERTEQILNRLDKVNKNTDQNTLRQLNEDVGRLIGTLNDSYLRNIRRVIERVNKVVGQPEGAPAGAANREENLLHQSGDRLDDPSRQPGFPGWDELLVAMDRVQKSLANFVRSSTKLVTSG